MTVTATGTAAAAVAADTAQLTYTLVWTRGDNGTATCQLFESGNPTALLSSDDVDSEGKAKYGPFAWDDAIPWESGVYRASQHALDWHSTGRPAWLLSPSPEKRDNILLHLGNFPDNSWGCLVAPGKFLDDLKTEIGANDFKIDVRNDFPLSISLTSAVSNATEGSEVDLTVRLNQAVSKDIWVKVELDGSSTANAADIDLRKDNLRLLNEPNASTGGKFEGYYVEIKEGQTTGTITVKINADAVAEGAEQARYKITDYAVSDDKPHDEDTDFRFYADKQRVNIDRANDTVTLTISDQSQSLDVNGSSGTHPYSLAVSPGQVFEYSFQAYTIPDALRITIGSVVLTSTGFVSGLNTGTFTIPMNGVDHIDVVVEGNSDTGTAWDLHVGLQGASPAQPFSSNGEGPALGPSGAPSSAPDWHAVFETGAPDLALGVRALAWLATNSDWTHLFDRTPAETVAGPVEGIPLDVVQSGTIASPGGTTSYTFDMVAGRTYLVTAAATSYDLDPGLQVLEGGVNIGAFNDRLGNASPFAFVTATTNTTVELRVSGEDSGTGAFQLAVQDVTGQRQTVVYATSNVDTIVESTPGVGDADSSTGGMISVYRDGDISAAQSISWRIVPVDSGATAGDLTGVAASGVLVFQPGEFVKAISFEALADGLTEGREGFRFEIVDAGGGLLPPLTTSELGATIDFGVVDSFDLPMTKVGGVGPDEIFGGSLDDTLSGSFGNDGIYAAGGADVVNGDQGLDILVGGRGDDRIHGGSENDQIYGGDMPGLSAGSGHLVRANGAGNNSRATAIDISSLFSFESDPDIIDSTTTPHVSITATGDASVHYYAISITASDAVLTFDVDYGGGDGSPAGFDSYLSLFNASGQQLATDDDSSTSDGGGGSTAGTDSFLQYTVTAPGLYFIAVGAYPSLSNVPAGGTYELQVSVSGQPLDEGGGGFADDDQLWGDEGDDTISGGSGADVINGGVGADRLNGGDGADTVSYAGSALGVFVRLFNSTAFGGDANGDVISGFENATGSSKNDDLIGSAGANVLDGGAGNDSLQGLGGDDTLIGGLGADTLNGGDGLDTISYLGSALAVYVRLSSNAVFGGDANGDVISNIENATGSSFNDDLRGSSGLNVLDGAAGDDFLEGQGGNDSLLGGLGADTLVGGAGGDTLNGGDGIDTVSYAGSGLGVFVRLFNNSAFGGDANGDVISNLENAVGSSFNDDLIGSAGVNLLTGGAGNDSLQGLGGDDTLIGGLGADTLNGGDGLDTISYLDSALAVYVRLSSNAVFGGDANGDVISNIENATGSSFNDDLRGSSAANRLDGAAGDDFLEGQGGNDTLIGGLGADTLVGGAGGDTLNGGDGIDTVSYAGSGLGVFVRLFNNSAFGGDANGDVISNIENVTGSSFNDDLIGSTGDNILTGGAGNDGLQGLSGADTLIGGAGGDTLNGGDGIDTISYVGSSLAVYVRLSTGSAFGGDANGDVISNVENATGSANSDDLRGSDGINTLDGSGGNDLLMGLAGGDTLLGGLGNDTLFGGAGGDTLNGGDGIDTVSYAGSGLGVFVRLFNNTVFGGDANGDVISNLENVTGSSFNDDLIGSAAANVLEGGAGNDSLTGQAGADRFVFSGASGSDVITDFAAGAGAGDVIQLSTALFTSFADVLANTADDGLGNTVISKSGVTIKLTGVLESQLAADDFVFAAPAAPPASTAPATVFEALTVFGHSLSGQGPSGAEPELAELAASAITHGLPPGLIDLALSGGRILPGSAWEHDWVW